MKITTINFIWQQTQVSIFTTMINFDLTDINELINYKKIHYSFFSYQYYYRILLILQVKEEFEIRFGIKDRKWSLIPSRISNSSFTCKICKIL